MSYVLPKLKYAYDSFEPFIDTETMIIHHTKHHQTYIDNTNMMIKKMNLLHKNIDQIIMHLRDIKNSNNLDNDYIFLKNNIGGHINHSIFWSLLKRGTVLRGRLKNQIEQDFNSFDNFKQMFEKVAISHFGSGWVWLVERKKKLYIESTINQDNPLIDSLISKTYGYPIFGLDIWEHAYYLKYKNRRMDYIQSFWQILNWDEVIFRFEKCFCSSQNINIF
ncbi:superoxide dismutase [Mn] [Buchnera aphidicola (Thelaxes californica)]|uniref:Superoxide dismutase n=1 Tax=Buchnera aphidicola (Thelaxes californica) TaxID=1315998 RepID=A0A4D6YBD4_9GAMM|nr:Fe-Mn family superoxide dismutase [Buchnera aphidicola]QCI26699.1 superoxide dismutase [Mn] [Buchnera aphidicola (Thelaxes californica)]